MLTIDQLRTYPLFAGLTEIELAGLASCLIKRTFARNAYIYFPGNPGLNLARPKRVKTPLLVLGGENDWALGPDTKATARAYGVQEEILPSVGHYMILEANWKGAADRILG
jgi:pimeloyl-ACP methyl ester carboxylesterase